MKNCFDDIIGKDLVKRMRTKYNCKSRHNRVDKNGDPIEMRMTFEEWLSIWIDSGKMHLIGRGVDGYVMCRKDDIGHYEVGNVFIASGLENTIMATFGELSQDNAKINAICLRTGYKRRIVKGLIKRGRLNLENY